MKPFMEKNVIDIGNMLNLIKKRKWLFYKTASVAFIIGLVMGFSMPKEYTTGVKLAPETGHSGLGGEINSLASMIGINLNGSNKTSDAFYPIMYPDICASNDFVIPLWNMQVKTIDGEQSTNLYDYLAHQQKEAWWWKGIEWITSLLAGSDDDDTPTGKSQFDPRLEVNPFHLTKEQDRVARKIKGMINCSVDKKTDVISISVTAQDPLVAATVADSVQHALQAFITDYRTTKARQDLEYMEKLYDEARTEYEQARLRYTSYADSNTELIIESYKVKQEDLENTMQLRYNIYSQMAQRLELAKAKVQEETPAFSVIQSATVPLKKSKPKRMTMVLGMMVLSFIITLLWVVSKNQTVERPKIGSLQSEKQDAESQKSDSASEER